MLIAPTPARPSRGEARSGQGTRWGVLLCGWGNKCGSFPSRRQAAAINQGHAKNSADRAGLAQGVWGERWPWRSKVKFPPSPASCRPGPSTVTVRSWRHFSTKETRRSKPPELAQQVGTWSQRSSGTGDPCCSPWWALIPLLSLTSASPTHPGAAPQTHLGPDVSELPADTGSVFL